jgi:hypothetical protein
MVTTASLQIKNHQINQVNIIQSKIKKFQSTKTEKKKEQKAE